MSDAVFGEAVAGGTEARLRHLVALASAPDETLAVGGAGLFVPGLVLGPGYLDAADEARIRDHLIAVARVRTAPLHPAVAWNCLYFGYNPSTPGYDLDACGDLTLAPVSAGERTEALPVGALVEYSSGGAVDHREWAEVVYKEGRPHGALVNELVRPEFSGRFGSSDVVSSGGVDDGGADEAVLQELLVFDFAPFVPLDKRADSWLERARMAEDRTYIDALGHIAVDAIYQPAEAADLDDVDYFCEWMLGHHREILARGWLGAALEDPDDLEALSEALSNSVRSVEDLLDRSPEFCEWGGYWYLAEDYEALLAERDAPGGFGDANVLVTSLSRVPRGARVAYHPLCELMVPVLGADCLTYDRYARSIVMLNAMIAQALSERAVDGVLHVQGEQISLRLDDRWLFGGTWRAERLDDFTTCSLVGFDPTITLGLGASHEIDDVHEPVVADPDEQEISEVGDPVELGDGQPFYWSTALLTAHRREQRIWVHPDAQLCAGPLGDVILRLEHQGELEEDERVQHLSLSADGRWLSPVSFPFDFFDGIRIACLAVRGGSVVFASTEPLRDPMIIGGRTFLYEFDRCVVDPSRPRRPIPRLVDQAVRTIDRHGENIGEGWRRLSAGAIAEIIFGVDVGVSGAQAIDTALSEAGERAVRDEYGHWCHRPGSPGRSRFEPIGSGGIFAGASARLQASVAAAAERHHRRHQVVLHLRKLSVSEQALTERQEAYKELREMSPNRANLPRALPSGYTYVVQHTRGGEHG